MVESKIKHLNEDANDRLKMDFKAIEGLETGVIIELVGYIDTYNSVYFQKKINQAISDGIVNFIFDCTGLSYISSTGIGSFTAFMKTLRPKGGNIVLVAVQPRVYEVFMLLGFAQFFEMRDSVAQGVEFYKTPPATQSTGEEPFPKIFACPICTKKLKVTKAGKFRCAECKTILSVDKNAKVFLG